MSQEGTGQSGFSLGGVYGSERADAIAGYFDNPGGVAGAKTNDVWLSFAVPPGPSCNFPYGFCRANTSYDEGRTEPRPGSWHHVVGVLDRPRNLFSVYIDGKPADTKIAEHAWSALGRFTVGEGQGLYPGDDSWLGAVDQLRTYARTLNAAEVWQLHRADTRR